MTEQEEFEFRARLERESGRATASTGDVIAGAPLTRLAMGAASPLIGALQFGAHAGDFINELTGQEPMVSRWVDKQIQAYEQAKQRGMKAAGHEGFDWMGLAGSAVPAGAIAKTVTSALPQAASLGTRMLTGGAAGAATAAAQPVASDDFATSKAVQVGAGGAAGAAVPLVAQALMAGKALVEPFYQKGREQIIGRALDTAAAPQQAQAIQNLKAARELVPGSQPTVGQASGNAGLASLERAATATSPESTNLAQVRTEAQNAARVKALGDVAQNDAALEAARQAREAGTAPLREAALRLANESGGVDTSTLTRRITGLASQPGIRASDVVSQSLGAIKSKIKELAGEGKSINAKDLYMVRKEAGNIVKKFAEETKNFDQRLTAGLVKDVQGYIDDAIEQSGGAGWRDYLTKYQELSRPVSQLKVAQAIADKSVNKLTGTLQPQSYANALTDRTAQTATGYQQESLRDLMTPQQMGTLNAIREDLIRAVQARNMAGSAGSDTVKKLAYTNLIDRAGVPTFLREFAPTQVAGNLLARGADTVYGQANRDIAEQLGQVILNPQEAARLMQQVGPSRFNNIVDAILQQTIASGGTAAGQRGGGR